MRRSMVHKVLRKSRLTETLLGMDLLLPSYRSKLKFGLSETHISSCTSLPSTLDIFRNARKLKKPKTIENKGFRHC